MAMLMSMSHQQTCSHSQLIDRISHLTWLILSISPAVTWYEYKVTLMPYILASRQEKLHLLNIHTHSNNNVCKSTQNIPNGRINIPARHQAGHIYYPINTIGPQQV